MTDFMHTETVMSDKHSTAWCGDAIDLCRTLMDGSVNCIITDPPYGVDAHSNFAATPAGKAKAVRIAGDSSLDEALDLFDRFLVAVDSKLADDCDIYVFTDWKIVPEWSHLLESHGYPVKQLLVWEKGWPGLGDLRTNWGQGHEMILYAKKGARHVNYRRSAVLHYDKPLPRVQVHPHEKPVPLLQELMDVSTDTGDVVLDPFMGSGSTLVAARGIGRFGVGFEIDEKHYDTACNRLKEGNLFS